MATQNRATLKSYFNTGDKPTESQFADLIDSLALATEVQAGQMPQTEHFHYVATTIQSGETPPTDLEIIGITPQTLSDAQSTVLGIVKDDTQNWENVQLGKYVNGFRAEYTDIQPDGSYTAKMIVSGLSSLNDVNEYDNFQVLVRNSNTGELKPMSWDIFSIFVDIVSNTRKTLASLSSEDINNAPANTEISISLASYTFQIGEYVQKISLTSNSSLGNLSSIISAHISLPGGNDTIDILSFLVGPSSTYIIPITFAQTLSSGQATLILGFDAGNGEVNPQNFTGGNFLTIKAIISRLTN